MISDKYYSPAKVNLFLYVLGKRADGYHNIYTLFYPISIYDTMILEKSDTTTILCNKEDIPTDNSNIILKTHNILCEKYNLKENFLIKLEKNIPSGAGLGGGSSNAATYLKAVNDISCLNLTYDDMANIMAMVGSDTVFFLKNIPQLAKGRGTELSTAPKLPQLYLIIINPNIHISTREIYNSSHLRLTNSNVINKIKKAYTFEELKSIMSNDMQNAVFIKYEKVKEIVDFLNKETSGFALMSGSGSTVFAVYSKENDRDEAYSKARAKYETYFIKKVVMATRG